MRKNILKVLSFIMGAVMVVSSAPLEIEAKQLNQKEKVAIGTSVGGTTLLAAGVILWCTLGRRKKPNISMPDNKTPNIRTLDIKESDFWCPGEKVLHDRLCNGKNGLWIGQVASVAKEKSFVQLSYTKCFNDVQEIETFIRCVVYNDEWSHDMLD